MALDEGTLEKTWRAGAAAHAGLHVTRDVFATFAEQRAATWRADLERAGDLYLACACAGGVPGAAERFIALYGHRVEGYLGSLATSQDRVDEVRQIVLVRCLVATEHGPPAIASFSGRGSLEGWVRATAVREALGLERDRQRELRHAEHDVGAPGSSPWSLAEHYREPVHRAFVAAISTLPAPHRALLRLHYVHGTTTAQLATMFQVSRATLVRRLTEARDALLALFQGELEERAGVSADDCVAVLRLVKGEIDLSLSSLLRESSG